MPFSKLTDEQIVALLSEKSRIESIPGVMLFWVDFIDAQRTESGIVVYVDARKREGITQLPVNVAGVPLVVKVEDRTVMKVVETIDPREHGGAWPNSHRSLSDS